MNIKLLELFGGIGAPRKALENIGYNIKSVDYVEILPYAVDVYNSLFDLKYKPQNIISWNMNVDLLVHGSPCQDFSKAGLNNIKTGRSILYERTLDIIKNELYPRPKYVLWENVKNLLISHKSHLDHYISSMTDLGYINHYEILNTMDYGLPQPRERVYTLSIRNDIKNDFDFKKMKKRKMMPLSKYIDSDSFDLTSNVFKESANCYILPRKKDGKMINGTHNCVWKLDKHIGTLTATGDMFVGHVIDGKLRYKRLTSRERFLLMGYSEKSYNNIKSTGISERQLNKLVGNSIPITVLEEIFLKLLACDN